MTTEFSSKIGVEIWNVWGSDKMVPETARVSSKGFDGLGNFEETLTDGDISLIEMLSENGHTSPFEHMGMSFRLDVPIFVMREWMRHRTQSYNEVSGRWKVLDGRFYVPDDQRPTRQVGRTGEYRFEPDAITNRIAQKAIRRSCEKSWDEYQFMLQEGVAKEVARMVLPVNIYTQVIVSANYLNWVRFLKLRATPQAMHEIRMAAFQVLDALGQAFPVSTASWFES